MNFGTQSNRCFRPNRPNPKAAGPAFPTGDASWVSFLSFGLAAFGTTCPPNSAAATARPVGVVSTRGPKPACGRLSGSESWPPSVERDASIFPVLSWTAPLCGLFLGAAHGAKPHRPPEKRLQTASRHRRGRSPADGAHHPGERPGREGGDRSSRCHSPRAGTTGPATLPPRNLPGRPRLRLGGQHPGDPRAGRPASPGPPDGRHPWVGARKDAAFHRDHPVVVQQSPAHPPLLRTRRLQFPGIPSIGGDSDLSQETRRLGFILTMVLQ